MNMEVSCAFLKRAFLVLITLKPLAEISGLTDVKRGPLAGFIFPGQNEITRHRPERSAQGMNLIGIFLAGRAGPVEERLAFRLMQATQ